MKSNVSLLQDGKKLAQLRRSVGRDHSEPRPLYPMQVAEYIDEIMKSLGDDSGNETARRLGISRMMLFDFLGMKKLPAKYSDVWGWGAFKGGRIPWSMFRRAGTFLASGIITDDDLGILINGVIEGSIPTSFIEDILYLKKKNPERSFEDCCKEILNLVPTKIESIVFISDLDPSVTKAICSDASKQSVSPNVLAESILAKYLGSENMRGVLLKDNLYIKIGLTELGRENIDRLTKSEDVLLTEVVNHIFYQEGYGNEQRSDTIREH